MNLFNSSISDEFALKGLHKLNDSLQKQQIGGVCQYGLLLSSNGTMTSFTNACISGVASLYNQGIKDKPIAWVHTFKTGKAPLYTRPTKVFSEWMQNDSPWKHAYLYSDTFNFESSNSIAVRCDVGNNYMATAMNVMRFGVENVEPLAAWLRMVDAGVNPSAAICLMLNLQGSEGELIFSGRGGTSCYHSILDNTSSEAMTNFLCGKEQLNNFFSKDLYYESKTYDGARSYLDGGVNDYLYKRLIKKLHPKRKVVDLGEDLMGESLGRIEGEVLSPEQINSEWSSLCKKYS